MSAVNEWVVREYFESLGFLVSQPRKYGVPGRTKTADEEIDLVVFNPRTVTHEVAPQMVWTTQEIRGIQRAVVGIRGWHTERFYVSTFENTPEILRFAEKATVEAAGRLLNSSSVAKILCLPRLPASGELRKQTMAVLKERGVDGVVSFQTLLLELVSRVETHRNYEKSDLLQIIRLLKAYDLIREPQMDLFGRGGRAPRKARPVPQAPETESSSAKEP